MGAIDLHAHWIPDSLADRLRRRIELPRIRASELQMPIGTLQFGPEYCDLDARLELMDRFGVARQLLSLPGLFGIDSLPIAESLPLVQAFNDALSKRISDRFSGLAALPLADLQSSIEEYRRARSGLGLLGAILPINAFVSLAEAEKLRPLLQVANELGGHLFLHPGRRPDQASLAAPAARDHEMERRALDVQTEVASAMITLLMSDFLDAFPRVSLHVANLGGTFPAVVERMDHMARLRTPGARLPSRRADRVHVDCSSLGPIALEQAVQVYGAERVVLGTDCPIFSTERTLQAVREARITDAARERILSRNAMQLLEPAGLRS